MQREFSIDKYKGLRFFLGDVRDKERLQTALQGIDFVVHAAALKQVPAAEYNPFEFIKTNVLGAQNLIESSIQCGVKKIIALSTDKAAAPINLYGATKLCSDKLFIAANNMVGARSPLFSIVRYGNVMGSRGSVVPYFIGKKSSGHLPITDLEMTRFNITLDQSVDMVLWAINNSIGGEVLVPKIPSYKIADMAEAICPGAKLKIIGVRPGEKIHEEMITSSDSLNTFDLGKYFAILSTSIPNQIERYKSSFQAKPVSTGFSYNSGTNEVFLTVEQIRTLITEHIDPNFR
jgi:UDP-N-acetylglucosamine 4,6-dehydratase (inverting)